MTITAYCACTLCCGPMATGLTASGIAPREGVTCAAPRSVPFGTWLHIEGIGWRRVEDRLARRYDNRIDIFFASHRRAKRFGKQERKITYDQRTSH